MSDLEKPSFGATLDTAPHHPLRPQISKESNVTTSDTDSQHASSAVAEKDLSNPFSSHHKVSEDQQQQPNPPSDEQKLTHLSPYTYDLEAGSGIISQTSTIQPKLSVDGRVKECTMWPSKQSLIDKEKERKRRQRGWWNITGNMGRRQRMWFWIAVVLLLVAAGVGLGVGISRAVGGGVWAGNGKTHNINSTN